MAAKATYTLTLRTPDAAGETPRRYELIGEPIDRSEMSERISELTGYRADYIERTYLRKVKISEARVLKVELGLVLNQNELLIRRVT